MSEAPEKKYDFVVNLISGGCAGVAVDVCLYPLDTLKTRFQAPEGFFKAGGFNGNPHVRVVDNYVAHLDFADFVKQQRGVWQEHLPSNETPPV